MLILRKIYKMLGKPPVTGSDPQKDTAVDNDNFSDDNSDSELFECVRKRTKRYYVGGFTSAMNSTMMYNYVTRRGPKVTKVNIYPSRRANDEVTIQLNVEANPESSLVEENGFWPRGIACKNWLTLKEQKSKHRTPRYEVPPRFSRNQWSSANPDFESDNRYQYLDF